MAAQAAAEEAPAPPADPLVAYYRDVRQMNAQLARDRYKNFYKGRTQEFIRGRGTVAIVEEDVCMGCTHCFDNCAFEAIDMADRKFSLPEYSYTSRKAIIIYENCVGCEKCAIVCPVDAITMIPKHGWEVKEGKLVQTAPPKPPAPKPPAAKPAPSAKPPEAKAPGPKPAPTAPSTPKPGPEETPSAKPTPAPTPAPPAPGAEDMTQAAARAPSKEAQKVVAEIAESIEAQAKRAAAMKAKEPPAKEEPPKESAAEESGGG